MSDYENPWTFSDKPFDTEDIGDSVGFVYNIFSQISGKSYIGRKYFYTLRKKKGATRRVKAESNWKKYYGSNINLLTELKEHGKHKYQRTILSLHSTQGDVNYHEVRQQFMMDVLESDQYYNDNINGKWYRKPEHIVEGRRYSESDLRFMNR